MSTRAYGFSVLASLVLIAAPAAPAAHKLFTAAPAGGPGQAMPQTLLVDGLSASTSADRLREFVGGLDGVASATIVTDRSTGQSRGFGFVDVTSVEAANTVIRQLNGQELDGRQLRIELASPAAERRGDFRGRPAGGGRW